MDSSASLKELAAAVAEAQAEFKAVGKSGENKFDRYAYANLEDYVRVVRPVLSKHGLSVLTSVDDVTALDDRTTKNGGAEHAVRVKLTLRLLHTSGEWVEAHSWGEGQDRADKSVYKAITGARKYALASVLGLATTDDPEADDGDGDTTPRGQQPQREPAPARQQKPDEPKATPEQVKELKSLIAAVKLPDGTTKAWFQKAGVSKLEDFSAETIAKCINFAKSKLPAEQAA